MIFARFLIPRNAGFKTIGARIPITTTQNSPIVKELTETEVAANLKEEFEFCVNRKPSGMLPVYRQYKNGRTRTVTVIRNVKGNSSALVQKLSEIIPEKRITRKIGGTLNIEGDYLFPVRNWLTQHKF